MIYDWATPFAVRDSTVNAARSLIYTGFCIEIAVNFIEIINPFFSRGF
jgi:hypothetical protein